MADIVKEWTKGATAGRSQDGRQYRRVFQVQLETLGDYPAKDAREATGIPTVGDAHPDDSAAKVRRVEAAGTGNRKIWMVNVDYEKRYGTAVDYPDDPLDEDPKIRWGAWTHTVAIEKDKFGIGVYNTAGSRFDPPLQRDAYELEVTITRNEASYSPSTARSFLGSVNAAQTEIAGYVAGYRKAKIVEYSGQAANRNEVNYYIVTYKIQFNEDRWDFRPLSHGLYRIRDGVHERCTDDRGKPAVSSKLLDEDGDQFIVQGLLQHFMQKRVFPEKDFSTLNLDI